MTSKKPKKTARIKKVYLKFYDHYEDSNADPDITRHTDCIIELDGWYLGETEMYFKVEVVKCNMPVNSSIWSVLKSAVIEKRGL